MTRLRKRFDPVVTSLDCEGADPEELACHRKARIEILLEYEDGSSEWVPVCSKHEDLMDEAVRDRFV